MVGAIYRGRGEWLAEPKKWPEEPKLETIPMAEGHIYQVIGNCVVEVVAEGSKFVIKQEENNEQERN